MVGRLRSAPLGFGGVMTKTGEPPVVIAERDELLKVSGDAPLTRWIEEVVTEHPAEAARFRAGERKLTGVLIGYVMKKSNGRADPKRVGQMLAERIGK